MFTEKDRRKCERLYDKYYSGRQFYDSIYRDLILRYIEPGQRLLDAGCGRYLKMCNDLSRTVQAVGIDLEPELATDNTKHPFGIRGDVNHLPFPSEYFDIVISRSVVEHLDDPIAAFREFFRVLRPGGTLVLVTPNKYDYVSLIASVTPHWFHQALVSRVCSVREDDVFPTRYRANTIRSLRRALKRAGFLEKELQTINHYPAYLMFSPTLFRAGVLYERITSLRPFDSLRGSIICAFQKQGVASSAISSSARERPSHDNAAVEVR
jgi:ubiquinone/menaquinone biosynthesis C-methylase UbiE